MIALKHTTLFLPHKRTTDATEAHLVCRVKWNASRMQVSLNLGYLIDPSAWDRENQICKRRSLHGRASIPASAINAEIDRYKKAVDKVFSDFAHCDHWPTAEEVRHDLRIELGLDAPDMLGTEEAYRRFMAEESITKNWSEDTIKKMRTTRDHILSFTPFRALFGFTSMNLALYIEHLRENRQLSDTTIKRHLANVKWFLKWCDDRNYMPVKDFKLFKPKLNAVPPPVVYLTWEELMRLWRFETRDQSVRQTLDFFLFCCFTSLRWSDCHNLKWSDFTTGTVTTIKTVDGIALTLNRWSNEIVSRYIEEDFGNDYVFCRTTNQVMNRQLKRVAQLCGFREPYTIVSYHKGKRVEKICPKYELIGTHTGRRTFICNSLILGIPPSVVMQWTGHSDYAAMRPYIAIADKSKEEQMAKFDDLYVTP